MAEAYFEYTRLADGSASLKNPRVGVSSTTSGEIDRFNKFVYECWHLPGVDHFTYSPGVTITPKGFFGAFKSVDISQRSNPCPDFWDIERIIKEKGWDRATLTVVMTNG